METHDHDSRSELKELTPAAMGGTSLDPSNWSEFRGQAHRMLDDMLGYTQRIRERPVWQPIPEEVRSQFHDGLPSSGTALAELHAEFMDRIVPFTAANTHPGFLGWVQGAGTPVGMIAEMLAAGLNANVGGRDQIPVEVERQVVRWMRKLFSFPEDASGIFVTGTSMANFLAVVTARDARLGPEVRKEGLQLNTSRLTAYASTATHESIGRALDFAGLGSDSLRLVPVNTHQQIDLDALMGLISRDRAQGFTPFLVVGNVGTVHTGAVDDLRGIAGVCQIENLWFHVDGAYGALAILAPELAPKLRGIERADSLAFDFHKWAQVPYDAGFLLVRDGVIHQQAFSSSCNYLLREEGAMAAGSPWPCDLGLDLSRSFRAFKTWATLKAYGTDALGQVVSSTCSLARYLESRILAHPELELMAAVELNIVCFRYRALPDDVSATTASRNRLNSRIVTSLQQAGAVAPSTTMLGDHLVIRAAIVNHRTSQAEIDTLVDAVVSTGRALHPAAAAPPAPPTWLPWVERDARVRQLDAEIENATDVPKNVEVARRFERAKLLTQLGRIPDARMDHLRVVELEPTNRQNLIDLGLLLVSTGHFKGAQTVFSEAVRHYPEDLPSRVNLGAVLLELDDAGAAREQYEAALRIDPGFPQAHGGMYYTLTRIGELERAAQHHQTFFSQKNIFQKPYRGQTPPIPVLLLVSSKGGNTPIEKLLDDRVFQTHVVVVDCYNPAVRLPSHRLIVNGVGDAEVSYEALVAADALLACSSAPALNAPAAVRASTRYENAERHARIDGLVTPKIASLTRSALESRGADSELLARGFCFPLLLRAPGFHMGKHFVRVDTRASLSAAVSQMPKAGHDHADLLVIEHLDARGADGWTRKYRVMMVDGKLYPLHLAISQDWKIHYFSAAMTDHPGHRAEEAIFLADMAGVLGPRAVAALGRLQRNLGLDYAGVDFGLSQDRKVLLFEANATMVVQQPDPGEIWDYRRPAVDRIQAAVHRMLLRSAGEDCGLSVESRPSAIALTGSG